MSKDFAKQDTFRSVCFSSESGDLERRLASVPGYEHIKTSENSAGRAEVHVATPTGDRLIASVSGDGRTAYVQNVLKQDEAGAPVNPMEDISVQFANALQQQGGAAQTIKVSVELSNRDRGVHGEW